MMRLNEIAVLLGAAVIVVPILRYLKLNSTLGYLAAGILVGPWVSGLIRDVEAIQGIADFGIVLLLFVIGLELQPTRLWALRKTVFGLGSLQMLALGLPLGLIAWAVGQGAAASLVIGVALALASTPLVLQTLAERKQLSTAYGRSAFGILLFQDIAVLPLLAALPMLAVMHAGGTVARSDSPSAWLAIAKLVGVIAALLLGGRLVLRPMLRLVARAQVTEVFTAAALLIVVGTAWVVSTVGLSMALGAFLAGVMLADSEFRHQLDADIQPFKGLLLGLFFMAVGMSANLGLFAAHAPLVAGLTVGLVAIKIVIQAGVGAVTGHGRAAAWQLGIALATGGEFAFVLFSLAAREQLIGQQTAELLVLAVTLSMILGPAVMGAANRLVGRWLAPDTPRAFDVIESEHNPVIIAGFGRFGQIVGRILTTRRIPYTALDANQTQVDFVRSFGNKVYYGDATRLELLRSAGVADAKFLVLAIDDVEASVRTAELVTRHFPQVPIFARARNRQHAFQLMDIGVRHIIRETLLSSLETAGALLQALGHTRAAAEATVARFQEHDARTLVRQHAVKDDMEKFQASTREAAAQLQSLFEADAQ